MVTKQMFLGAVAAALIIGFIGGTVYSSFKLTPQKNKQAGAAAGMPSQNNAAKMSEEIASKIFQLEKYIAEHPDDADAQTQLGHLFFDSDQYENAINAYNRSLALKPGDPAVITDLGVMYRRNKQPRKAVETFDRAIQADPKFETAYFNKGVVLLHDLEDVDGGISAWEALVKINPLAVAPNGESVDAIIQRMKSK